MNSLSHAKSILINFISVNSLFLGKKKRIAIVAEFNIVKCVFIIILIIYNKFFINH